MSQLRQHEAELARLGVAVALVTFQGGPVVENYVRETALSWPVLLDEDRSLYTAYDMDRGSAWAILGPSSWGTYLKLILRGRRPQRATGDIWQRGGDVLIDPQGTVCVHHVGTGPADRPAVEELLAVVRRHDGLVPRSTRSASQ